VGFLALLVSSYWAERTHGARISTELAAIFTFFLGVLIIKQAYDLAIALAIVALAVLFPKQAIKQFRCQTVAGGEHVKRPDYHRSGFTT
jgi:uncharacterized membrane protein (DUF4010 family)